MFSQKESQEPEVVLKQHSNSVLQKHFSFWQDFGKARNFEIRSILFLRHKYAEKEVRKHHLTFSNLSATLSKECLAWQDFYTILILNSYI